MSVVWQRNMTYVWWMESNGCVNEELVRYFLEIQVSFYQILLFIKIHRSQIQILTRGLLGDAFMLIWTWNMNFIWHTIYCDRIVFRINLWIFHKKSLKNNHERLSVMAYKYSFINNSILKRKLNNIAVTFASKITNICFWMPLVALWRKSSFFFPALALNLQV